ncbi:amino acid permease [Streptomyces sp. TSRI0384-2]|uniref:Amino acid permease n=3 Tax=Streptomyces diastaticus group TaxID=2849069 RepID=A0A8H9HJ97_9ACTN|nr:APA family basic amino acid/polyamine antiporter [Streptomyces sp. DSM 41037]NEC10942.1 amino acid permease [Streptomyces sp. SID8014]NEE59219.1 amino acid permease [Streptomyces sp. SID8455]PJM81286.1 amino acid permease [Streptomyces sp. TSRI0384-2]QNE83766.1 amino acid permease [Streptomyces rutgersensis]GFH73881.1 amino acid permease [Streptomyces diastaticus subsp. diastaticus]GFH78942.1 amino acid permease [Streptomyces gougerotii]
MSTLFRTKSVEQSIRDTEEPETALKKSLSALDLTVFGVGVIIGTGIFVLTGKIAKETAGPSVAIAFVVAGLVCALAALCYAEFASTVPVAGSAYTFSYASLGEFPAWIIGWDLILELALGCAVVAVGWSGYMRSLLDTAGVHLPQWLSGTHDGQFGFDLLACLLVVALTLVLVAGMKLSSRVTGIIVAVKVTVVLLVVVVGAFFITGSHYDPFVPPSKEVEGGGGITAPLIQLMTGFTPADFGVMGVFTAAAVVFFAFIGFDIVATAAEETRNPQRDVPRGILGSLLICTLLYVAVSVVVTGMQKYTELSTDAPLADAFKAVGHPFWAGLISFGAAVGLTSVSMILLLGQTRVFFAMSRDGLLPRAFSRVHPRFGTPYRSTLLLGGVVALLAGFTSIDELAELVNIGTLFAFVVVALGVILLRRSRPDLPRAFRTPLVPLVPVLSVLASLWLMLNLPAETWLRFGVWMLIGVAVYFVYGRTHSRVGRGTRTGA